jgi:hypothetical protein
LRGASGPLPHYDRIQRSFGRHDLANVQANIGGEAREANEQLGSLAYTRGTQIAFKENPDIRLAAHEAAHVVQQARGVQLKDGLGRPGDRYELQADRVADRIVDGKSVEGLLDAGSPSPLQAPATSAHTSVQPAQSGAMSQSGVGGSQRAPARDEPVFAVSPGEGHNLQAQPAGDRPTKPDADRAPTSQDAGTPNACYADQDPLSTLPPTDPNRGVCQPTPPQPPPGGEVFVFQGESLSRDEAFCLYTLERLQDTSLESPYRLVNEFKIARRQKSDSLEGEKRFRDQYASDPSGVAAGVPLQDDMFAALEAEVKNLTEIEPTLDAALRTLEAHNTAFVADFDRESTDLTLAILQLSEDQALNEAKRYGLTEREIKEEYIQEISDREWRRKTRTRTERGMADNPESQKLVIAARALSMKQAEMVTLHSEQMSLMRSKTMRYRGEVYEVNWLPEENKAPYEALGTRIDLVKRDYDVLRAATDAEYPLLASMSDPTNLEAQRNLAKLGQGVGLEAAAVAGEKVAEVIGNIAKSREALSSGDLKPWKLPRIVGATKLHMNIEPGSAKEKLIDRTVEARVEDESRWSILLAAITIGLAIIAAIPTGGMSLVGAAVVFGAGAATVGIGAYVLLRDLREYDVMTAAYGSALAQAQAISAEEPTLLWVALDIIGLGFDIGGAMKAFRGLAPAARGAMTAGRSIEELEPALRALRNEGNAVKKGLGDALVEDALRTRGATEEAEDALRAGARTGEAAAEGIGPKVKESLDFLQHAICGLCFAAGTQVVTSTGRRPIETIRAGDLVLARHESDPQRTDFCRVTETYCNATDRFIEVEIAGQVIRSTPGHVWWCEEKGWIFAQELELGDHVVTDGGAAVSVASLRVVDDLSFGYNLAVEEFGTYFVAASHNSPALWVHNTSAMRVLEPEQVFQLIFPKMVINNPSAIRKVVGDAIRPQGNYTTEIGGLFQYVRKGGGAGFHGFTKESVDSFEIVLQNLAKKGGQGTVAAIDLASVGKVPIYDLTDPLIFNKVLSAYPNQPNMWRTLGEEGVIAIGGKVPAGAVRSMVHIPPGITESEQRALLAALLKACKR